MRLAAPEAALVDFGLRRAHSGESGLMAARAAYLAGFAGTASVAAGRLFGLPLLGTMAHSYIQAHEDETAAFRAYAEARPQETTFLIDTYDVARGAERVAALAPALAAEGIATQGVRIDSGDLAAHARRVRAILDGAGLGAARIIASGGLDEDDLAGIVASGAPIDGFGIGTSLVTSEDMPALDIAYKLKAYAGRPVRKLSEGKSYWPGPTQVWRRLDAEGRFAEDVIAAAGEDGPKDATPLLRPVLRDGAPVGPAETLEDARARAAEQLARLPEPLTRRADAPEHPVRPTPHLERLAAETTRRLRG
jgi:nicotinate phosphoribosyltransferase